MYAYVRDILLIHQAPMPHPTPLPHVAHSLPAPPATWGWWGVVEHGEDGVVLEEPHVHPPQSQDFSPHRNAICKQRGKLNARYHLIQCLSKRRNSQHLCIVQDSADLNDSNRMMELTCIMRMGLDGVTRCATTEQLNHTTGGSWKD